MTSSGESLCPEKGTTQPGTGLGHRPFRPGRRRPTQYRKPWFMPPPARQRTRYAGCAQAIDVSLAVFAQRVVFDGHHESRRQDPRDPAPATARRRDWLLPLLTGNGRCGLGEGTFATTRGKGQDAPIPDLPALVSERQVRPSPVVTSPVRRSRKRSFAVASAPAPSAHAGREDYGRCSLRPGIQSPKWRLRRGLPLPWTTELVVIGRSMSDRAAVAKIWSASGHRCSTSPNGRSAP